VNVAAVNQRSKSRISNIVGSINIGIRGETSKVVDNSHNKGPPVKVLTGRSLITREFFKKAIDISSSWGVLKSFHTSYW